MVSENPKHGTDLDSLVAVRPSHFTSTVSAVNLTEQEWGKRMEKPPTRSKQTNKLGNTRWETDPSTLCVNADKWLPTAL